MLGSGVDDEGEGVDDAGGAAELTSSVPEHAATTPLAINEKTAENRIN
jgi:hypothetical protein